MILDTFSLHNLIVQVQYDSAYALWDRAGAIAMKLSEVWPNLVVKEGQPQQQTLAGNGVQIQTGFSTSTVTISNSKAFDQRHVRQLSDTFEIWRSLLELKKLNRISTRAVFGKTFSSIKEANDALLGLNLTAWPETKVFDQPLDSGQNGLDIQYRFEDEKSFAVLRVRAEKLKIEVGLDPFFFDESSIEKEKNRLVIDFDRGLLGSINVNSIRLDEWMKGFQHLLHRDLEKVLKVSR
jgi:hypothetical protein